MNFKIKRVAILCGGGSSSEREVSLCSGRAVFEAIKSHIDAELFELSQDQLPKDLDPERFVVFPMIHGEFGEDGQLQALLEAKHFTYCGSNGTASRLCMDKARAKEIAKDVGALTAQSLLYEGQNFTELWDKMGGPFVIKPNDRGSSIGVAKVYGEDDFIRCLEMLEKGFCSIGNGEHKVAIGAWLIEACIEGRELTVSILGEKALPVIEMRAKDGFYDYQHKYTSGMTEYLVPAPISETQYIQNISEKIFKRCGCRGFGRLDFILNDRGEFYFLEINTIPGMTATSLVPKAAAAVGISFRDLCLKILESAMENDYHISPPYRSPKSA